MQHFSSRVRACSENLIGPFQTGSHQTNQKLVKKMSTGDSWELHQPLNCVSLVSYSGGGKILAYDIHCYELTFYSCLLLQLLTPTLYFKTTWRKNRTRPPVIRTPMDIQAQYFVYKPFKGYRTKWRVGPKFGQYELWDIRPCTLREVRFWSANKTSISKIYLSRFSKDEQFFVLRLDLS